MNHTHRLVYIALLTALSLALYLLEGLIPMPFLAPGAKLGLANLITVLALYTLPRWQDAATILMLRILLASLFGGGPTVMLYSLIGGLQSLVIMVILLHTGLFSPLGVSSAGGFVHNLGQLLTATLLSAHAGLLVYLPILGPCGLATGFLIGYTVQQILPKIQNWPSLTMAKEK